MKYEKNKGIHTHALFGVNISKVRRYKVQKNINNCNLKISNLIEENTQFW